MSEQSLLFAIMQLTLVSVLCVIKVTAGGWLRDLISPKGWDIGDGVVVHLVDSKLPNTTFLQRHSMVMDYGGLALSVSQALDKEALRVGLHPSGRGYKDYTESAAVSMIIGYKLATMATLAFSAVGALVLKALSVAKIAAVLSMILLVSKLFHHNQHQQQQHQLPAYIEIEPEFAEISPEEYFPSASSDYYSYASFPPGIDYVPETSGGNSTPPGDQQVSRRRDVSKRRRVPLLTIHQYSIKS